VHINFRDVVKYIVSPSSPTEQPLINFHQIQCAKRISQVRLTKNFA